MREFRRLRAGDAGQPSDGEVRAAARTLADGGMLAHPTDTVYGIGGAPRDLDREIARLKGRPPEHPLLRIGADAESLRRAHPELEWDERARRLAAAFWPGPLTLVLPDGSGRGLGVRVEGHPVTARILAAWGGTMSSTSLNRTGGAPARTSAEAEAVLAAMPEPRVEVAWVDVGDLTPSPPSTVVCLRGAEARVLRDGAVPAREIEARLDGERARG